MIELEHVSAGYAGAPVLRDISARFDKGSLTCIVGPNGCGKSTLLKVLGRLLAPSAGDLRLSGAPYAAYAPKAFARRVAMLPQTRSVPAISVASLVMHGRFPHLGFPRRPGAQDRRMAAQAMAQAGVEAWRARDVRTLSGGERQRVYLAMLLAQDADVLLLDEPATYLDINHQLEMLGLIDALHAQGKTVIMVLHDLAQALQHATHLLVLRQGALYAQGAPEDVFSSGALQDVFGVRNHRVRVDGQTHYLFTPRA
nr:ABC transporter ATP-binding protein [Maliibacterium massiliense]